MCAVRRRRTVPSAWRLLGREAEVSGARTSAKYKYPKAGATGAAFGERRARAAERPDQWSRQAAPGREYPAPQRPYPNSAELAHSDSRNTARPKNVSDSRAHSSDRPFSTPYSPNTVRPFWLAHGAEIPPRFNPSRRQPIVAPGFIDYGYCEMRRARAADAKSHITELRGGYHAQLLIRETTRPPVVSKYSFPRRRVQDLYRRTGWPCAGSRGQRQRSLTPVRPLGRRHSRK